MTEDKFDLSRRKVLGSLGVVGTGAVLGGAGTAALFNDEAEMNGNEIEAGELALQVETDWEHDKGDDVAESQSGGVSFEEDLVAVQLFDAKPGDSGYLDLCLQTNSNPGWVWMQGIETANDGIGDEIEASLKYDDGSDVVASGSLSDVLAALEGGVLLDSDPSTTDEEHFPADTPSCVTLDWELPLDTGNDVQNDEVKFNLEFYAEQRRHNPDPDNPF